MAEDDFEKTETATPRKRQEARENGNVARSQDLTAAVVLLASVAVLYVFGLRCFGGLKQTVEAVMSGRGLTGNLSRADDLPALGYYMATMTVTAVAPLVLTMAAVGLLVSVSQVGLMVTGKPLNPDLSKLSPLRGLKNLFDARAGVRLAMSVAKLGIIGAVAAWVILDDLPMILSLSSLSVASGFAAMCQLIYELALKLAALLLVLGASDYAFQYWNRERDLRMSKQEVKEEMRRMEGDPLVKQRRGRVARQLAMQRIGQAVPKADVVVTNPTHFAVALRYDSRTMRAPKVVAKGADLMAMRIRQLAVMHGVPMVERKELARALYRSVEVGREVPPEFYNAVAEILAYVYRIGGRRTA